MSGACARALLVTLLAGLALAGCGEGEETTGTGAEAGGGETTAAPPATQPLGGWIVAADGLCADAMAEQEAIRRDVGGNQVTLADRARLLVDLAPPREQLAADLGALPAPDQERAAARSLVRTAERRAEASAEAGRLYESNGPRGRIAAAAAAEHDERERFVVIADGIGMTDCAEILSAADEREVAAAIEQGLGSADPSERCAAFGRRFLAELYGGGEGACVAAGGSGYATGEVSVGAPEGMDEVFALAVAEVSGTGGSQSYRVRLTYEDGAYKIDKLD